MAEMRLEGCEQCSAGRLLGVKRFACRHERVGGVDAIRVILVL